MPAPRYWFRKVPGTGSRYIATCWQGYAAIAAVPVGTLALTGLLAAVHPVAALAGFPIILIVGLALLFAGVARRAEP